MPVARSFDLVWSGVDNPVESEDLERTLVEVRKALASVPGAQVRLSTGTRQFGERLLMQLNEDELVRITVVLAAKEQG